MVQNMPCMQDLSLAVIVVAIHATLVRTALLAKDTTIPACMATDVDTESDSNLTTWVVMAVPMVVVFTLVISMVMVFILVVPTVVMLMMVVLVATDFMAAIRFVVERIVTAPFMVMMVTAVCMVVTAIVAGAVAVETTIHRPAHVCLSPLLSLRIFVKPA